MASEVQEQQPAANGQRSQQDATQSLAAAGIQMENIKVAVRLRPFTEKERQRGSKRIVDIEQNTIALDSPKHGASSLKKFTFDYSYWSHDGFKRNNEGVNVPDPSHPNCSKYVGQEKVFEDLGVFLLNNALQGYNSALLAYGQTGSGKSYTVSGYGQNEGILPRFARALFAELDKRVGSASSAGAADSRDGTEPKEGTQRARYEVYFSMIEIYNEVVRDLLTKNHGYAVSQTNLARRGLKVREHPKRGFFVEGLTTYRCANKEDIEQRIEEGQLNKSIAATSMNETSSRGHTIYEFNIKQYNLKLDEGAQSAADETLTTSVVQLVDLAGSERLAVHVTGQLGGDSFIGSRANSPYPRDENNFLATGSVRATRGSRRRVPTTSASSTASSSTATTTANQQQQQQASMRRQIHNKSSSLYDNHQQRFKESVSINQSLSALGNCIQVLSQYSQQIIDNNSATNSSSRKQAHKIPYRDSVLTKLLNRCCLSGVSKFVIIATLSPADTNYDDTLSTLRFADRAKQIKTHAVVNRMSRGEMVNVLQRENERLKQMIDGRVTRSDDSSQTSNFDDTENLVDNFNGPKSSSGQSSTTVEQQAHRRHQTTTRIRTNTRTRGNNQQKDLTDGKQQRDKSSEKYSHRHKMSSRPMRLTGSSSNPSLALDEQMKRIVSPAATKLAKEAEEALELGEGKTLIKKSRSMGTGLPNRADSFVVENNDQEQMSPAHEGAPLEDELEFVSGLLDEIDFNELADIEEGLLSPDSDDSFAALAEESLTNEEKIGLLNKLLSNTNVADKIRKQYEMKSKDTSKVTRPRRSYGGARVDNGISRVTAISSHLKKSNPYLSNLNPDEQLTGMIAYIIKQGETIVGKNSDCDILLYGPELRGRHARITRIDLSSSASDTSGQDPGKAVQLSQVFIEPIIERGSPNEEEPGGQENVAIVVNGAPVTEKTQLHHCDRILFGSNAYFVFIDQSAANSGMAGDTIANQDLVTYDMAHNEALKKVMSEAKNEAVIKEINHYTHRPGTGKHKARVPDSGTGPNEFEEKRSHVKSLGMARGTTIHDAHEGTGAEADKGAAGPATGQTDAPYQTATLDEQARPTSETQEENYRDKLMEDTYEYTMPVAEVNAIAREMQIKVNYGLKILTGEEQLPECVELSYSDSLSSVSGSTGDNSLNDEVTQRPARVLSGEATSSAVVTDSIKPESLDIPPALFVQVHLEDLNMDFYWSKEKFQARRFRILELYGAWDVGGKSGLVEYLIEQSKYQGDSLIDPFIDEPRSCQVLIGHAQVTLEPLAHLSDMHEAYDIMDLNDEIVGSINIQAIPCHSIDESSVSDGRPSSGAKHKLFRPLEGHELADKLVENPSELLGKKLIFLIKILSCKDIPQKYDRIYCQYTLNRDKSIIRTKLRREHSLDSDGREVVDQVDSDLIEFNHWHFVTIDKVDQDIIDFLAHGFLAIQVVGHYRLASGGQTTVASPTLITTIINSINKYKFSLEHRGDAYNTNYSNSIYTNSVTDSAKSNRVTSSGIMNSNSGASSVASTSATVNLFDQQNDDDEGINSMNGLSQENIIDMILTKRKLDRAENQLVSL